MRIFIPSHNRPEAITTPSLLNGLDYKVLLHDQEQYNAYTESGRVPSDRIVVTNQPHGLEYQRNWILDQLAEGEWAAILDDNIKGFWLGNGNKKAKREKEFWEATDAEGWQRAAEETIAEAERVGALLCGFAVTDNYFFAMKKKYTYWSFVVGRMMLVRGSRLRFDSNVRAKDDYCFTAQNLLSVGKVVVNHWFLPKKNHYTKGGSGTITERAARNRQDVDYLLQVYPGLFAIKNRKGRPHGTEIMLLPKRTVASREKWRKAIISRIK